MTNHTSGNPKYKFCIENVIFFTVLHLIAALAFIPAFFSWSAVAVFFVLYWMTASLGICLGYHRLLTHRSFQLPKPLTYFFATLGALSCENGPIKWVGQHRMHHAHSDTDQDPHNANRGFLWSHLSWMLYWNEDFDSKENINNWTKDICQDKYLQFLDNHFIKLQIALGLILLAIGGLPWVIWGIFLRLIVVYHVTWLVNSASHMFGYRTFTLDKDLSTNCWWVGLLAMGEGWHNNHHAFPQSARHGLRPWEFDITWVSICILRWLGLATQVKVVTLTPLSAEKDAPKTPNPDFFKGEMVKVAA